jgi:peptide chain release factor 3
VTPASWPIGMGRDFLGTYDLFADALLLFERGVHHRVTEPVRCGGLGYPKLPRLLPKPASLNCARRSRWRKGFARDLTPEAYRGCRLSPVSFGNALNRRKLPSVRWWS